ncbi:adenylate/guanylate cyclase domain-containing protein [Parvularcula lutaonensis]|uniref:CHASE2 domain-containing protein n=1 Tax=Parvularcula lutaonensis TaxID=491923 RepID=A0ABV7MF45_9PROT|nr:adenylate/guanylate cyclase domain-containing protein [Parvularcula lutaonensis]GGY52530.1 guanylate cyclase [Parvularcula lutaonensis]
MFEQRQEQRLRLLLLPPAVIILLIAVYAILSSQEPGHGPRETMFDLITRLAPREVAEEFPAATILIDEESEERLGNWPWPRSAFARLIDAAENAGAESVTLTVSVAGDDPLSPDIIARRWLDAAAGDEVDRVAALSVLPSNDLVLARAVAGGPVALGIGAEVRDTGDDVAWARVSLDGIDWLELEGATDSLGYIALPSIIGDDTLSAELREARIPAVTGLPRDPGGRVRRFAPVYAAGDEPAPSAGLAALAASGRTITLTPKPGTVSSAGSPPASIALDAGEAAQLDGRAELRIWLPKDLSVPSVPAWRILDDPETWAASLDGKHVFIGEAVSENGIVQTTKSPVPAAQLHALIAGQLDQGAFPVRPAWAGFAEAFAAISLGAVAVLAVIFLPTGIAVTAAAAVAILNFIGAYAVFRTSGILLDPAPAIFASIGGPLAVALTVLTNMMVRDDAVRGAFHGALPQKAMRKLQSHGGARLLHGVHREVTVLSCAFRLPPNLVKEFEKDPKDYVLFQASANDRLRRTILEHEGTVDYGEDGRLLGYWNVPLDEPKHIELACACALKMLDDVSAMSQQVSASGHHLGKEDLADGRIEIGIATGEAFAGPVGLGGRNRYAALGQPVSFAGRLRARSEVYGPAILTDARVYDKLRHHYAFLDLDFVRRDSAGQPEMIYGLVGNPFLKASKSFRDLAEVQRELLSSWKARDLTAATRALQKLRGIPGVPQPYVELFEQRIMNARLQRARREGDHAEVLGP